LDLEGNLRVFEPVSVFQMLNLAQASGELALEASHNSARLFFDHGNVTFAEIANKPMRLGEYLVKKGLISKEDLEKALQMKPKGKRIGRVLVARKVIEEAALRSAIEDQIKDVVYEVVRWREGKFGFKSGAKPQAQDVKIDVPLDHLMLEGLKRMDEAGEESK
jgi:hypothetical protein